MGDQDPMADQGPMADQDWPDPEFDAMTNRLIRREALRRAAEELNTGSGPGLEGVLARISAEMTADAAEKIARTAANRPKPVEPNKA
jgi:phage shock protein A